MSQKVTIGRIVEFFPNGNVDYKLPNNMATAPAIVVQVFDKHANMNLQVADPHGKAVSTAWSVCHKDDAPKDEQGNLLPGTYYWDWFQKV